MNSLRGLLCRFRSLASWAQVAIVAVVALVIVSPFTSEAEEEPWRARTTTSVGATTAIPLPALDTTATATTLAAGVPAAGDDTTVVRVVDGDTIEVAGGTRVRLIGVDTPETGDCFSREATRYANELLPAGTHVRLAYDVARLDSFGRTLAYVYKLSDGVFVNVALAGNGFAQQLTVPPNVAHAEEFRVAAASARSAKLGLWQTCATPVTAVAPVTAAPTTQATVARLVPSTSEPAASGCHPSYAGACVPTGFSDVDCAGGSGDGPGYISAKRFQVVGPDVYRLDGSDNDGIACES
jgi:endonuclease YncB( thermonuclease family)